MSKTGSRARRTSDTVVVDRTLEVTTPASDGCTTLRELVLEEEVGPKFYQRFTQIYCETSSTPFMVVLVNWKGDPDQPRHEAVALAIARSLRIRMGED